MKIIATADLHGKLGFETPEGDLLVIAGDVCPDFPGARSRFERAYAQKEWITQTFLPWVERQPQKEKVMIWGNHDFVGEFHPEEILEGKIQLLHMELREFGGKVCYGFPLTHMNCKWAFDVPPEKLEHDTKLIPKCEVLITHAPPFGMLDQIAHTTFHVGNPEMVDWLTRNPEVQVVICGHIHEGFGMEKFYGTRIYNVASVDERYHPRAQRWVEIEV